MLKTLALSLLLLCSASAFAQDRTLRILVGFPAGAGLDTMTRLLADRMKDSLGHPVIVENRPGAGGRIVMQALKNAPADGSTLVMTPLVTVVTAPHLYKDLGYDPFKDFAPVAHTGDFLFAFSVGPNVPAKTLAEYIALVKQDPKWGNYSSAAPGSLPHFFSILFAEKAGLKMNHIGYKGTAQALTDLFGGQIAAFMGTAGDAQAHHQGGKMKVLATSGAQRAQQLPDIPTFRELGYDIEGAGWYAAYGPAAMPKDAIDRVSKAMIAAVKAPELKGRFDALGIVPTGHPPAELARIHKRDYELWGPVIRASGFKPEN
ncbi:MAG TPA: Bug family tripartite tricarboxylate transporter substrate binding protein [Burkholderiales bacterium]|nr:Bug family tripartite tricarboxylate transporter substrate binding protein [Burkholderiales bacterium]